MESNVAAAIRTAGFRELFAIRHGERQIVEANGHVCWKFVYSPSLEYQDANGAVFDTVCQRWIS